MDAMKNLLERRSIRKFKDQMVEKPVLEEIIEAARNAPSGRNRQPVAFAAAAGTESRDILSKLNADVLRETNPDYAADPFYGAPAVIAVLADPQAPTYIYDGSLAMSNLLHAAHAKGIGACWIHRAREVFEGDEGKQLLKDWGLEGYEGIGFAILGYPDQKPEKQERKSKVLWV